MVPLLYMLRNTPGLAVTILPRVSGSWRVSVSPSTPALQCWVGVKATGAGMPSCLLPEASFHMNLFLLLACFSSTRDTCFSRTPVSPGNPILNPFSTTCSPGSSSWTHAQCLALIMLHLIHTLIPSVLFSWPTNFCLFLTMLQPFLEDLLYLIASAPTQFLLTNTFVFQLLASNTPSFSMFSSFLTAKESPRSDFGKYFKKLNTGCTYHPDVVIRAEKEDTSVKTLALLWMIREMRCLSPRWEWWFHGNFRAFSLWLNGK